MTPIPSHSTIRNLVQIPEEGTHYEQFRRAVEAAQFTGGNHIGMTLDTAKVLLALLDGGDMYSSDRKTTGIEAHNRPTKVTEEMLAAGLLVFCEECPVALEVSDLSQFARTVLGPVFLAMEGTCAKSEQ
jgi:hypothetical protein